MANHFRAYPVRLASLLELRFVCYRRGLHRTNSGVASTKVKVVGGLLYYLAQAFATLHLQNPLH